MPNRNLLILIAAAAVVIGLWLLFQGRGGGGDAIRIGEVNSYSAIPQFTEPYRKGWQLAVAEINDAGGVLGRPIEVISRDDGGKPGDAVRIAADLKANENVVLVAGTFLSNVGLAVADWAKASRTLFMAAEPLSTALTWEKGNRYTFRLRPNTYMQAAMLAEAAAELPATRWATIAPNYEYGQSAVDAFKTLLSARKPDVEWVAAQWPPLFKLDAGPTIEALIDAEPEAIYNVTFGPDLAKFVREGETRGLFEGRDVVSLLTGEPEYLEPLGAEAPIGWIVTGYPWYGIETEQHQAFLDAYAERYDETPKLGSVVGYITFKAIAAGIEKAGSTETDAMIAAMKGLELPDTPFGLVRFRALDHQSTMGAYVGRTGVSDGNGVMVDFHYADGADYMPADEEIREMRPEE